MHMMKQINLKKEKQSKSWNANQFQKKKLGR